MAVAALGAMMGMQALPMIMQMFGGDTNAYKGVERAMNKGNKFAAAAADPTSAMYKAAKAEAEGPLRRQATEGMEEMFKLARRAKARGYGSSLVNPERRDEMRSKGIMEAFEKASMMGGHEARERLSGAARSFYEYAQPALGLGDRYRAEEVAKQQNFQQLMGMGGSLMGAGMQQFWPTADKDIASFFSGGSSWGPKKTQVVSR
jgi:hypothetical protein